MLISEWDRRFLALASHISSWSKDPSTKVGAVISDLNMRVISLGFNGPPRGINDERALKDRETKYATTIHAEENAILFASQPLQGYFLYITHLPCSNCASKIIQVGISRIICPSPTEDMLSRWKNSFDLSQQILQEAGVKLDIVKS